MKFSALALPLIVLTLVACTPAESPTGGEASSSASSIEAMTASSVSEASVSSSGVSASAEASVSINPSVTKIVKIDAANFEFTPNSIRVKKGEKVIIRLTSSDGIHGFGAPDLGINQRVAAGESHDITLDTSKAGTYTFFCTVPCGPGHKQMTGTIVIE